MTGGGNAPAEYTKMISSFCEFWVNTPIYKGIKEADYDTPIEVAAGPGISAADVKACDTLLRCDTSSLVEALNSGNSCNKYILLKYSFTENALQRARL